MISWNGILSFDSLTDRLLNSDQQQTTNDTVGLFLVCGSWNRPGENTEKIQDLLSNVFGGGGGSLVSNNNNNNNNGDQSGSDNYTILTGILQVDGNDGLSSTCCGDDNCDAPIQFPCPPERLPALLFIGNRPRMPHPEVKYLQSLTCDDILMHWKQEQQEQQQQPGATTMKNLTNLSQEVEDRLLYLGLRRGGSPSTTYSVLFPSSSLSSENASSSSSSSSSSAIRIFIAGDRMSVGKTSVCLGLIGSLLQRGIPPSSLAYIKPATQNESPQLVQRYCEKYGIDCIPIGPVVYYRGFTRAFLAGQTETTAELLAKAEEAVDGLAKGKRVVIVDGVGFPAVGSICGTDNASVARASGYPSNNNNGGRIPPGVLLVGGSGVGGAVDAFNLNATYFEAANVPVIGAIFNKLSLDGFYSLENCKTQITSYFTQNAHQRRHQRHAFGFVPMYAKLGAGDEDDDSKLEAANEYVRIFDEHVDMDGILQAAAKVQRRAFETKKKKNNNNDAIIAMETSNDNNNNNNNNDTTMMEAANSTTTKTMAAASPAPPAPKRQKMTSSRTREEIEQAAIQAGAAPSA